MINLYGSKLNFWTQHDPKYNYFNFIYKILNNEISLEKKVGKDGL